MTVGAKIYHCLNVQQFDRAFVEENCTLADRIRDIAKSKTGAEYLSSLLNHKRAMLYFVQPSTRTFLSFYSSCQILGIRCAEVRDTKTSSEIKGESEQDTIRTFSSYVDLIIMRHPQENFADNIASALDKTSRRVPIINAGSGKDQHPTQALLDIYTLQRSFRHRGGIDGKKVAFVGDLRRGRTVRSLSLLLSMFDGVKLYFVAPQEFQMTPDILKILSTSGTQYEITDQLEKVIPEVDALYVTRLQDEWDSSEGGAQSYDVSRFSVNTRNVQLLKPDAVILHPLPRREEISPEVDLDPRAVYWRQVRNGMWSRVALITQIFGASKQIDDYYISNY
jgi:aspartate carbamoyltransferase catalytic subunit